MKLTPSLLLMLSGILALTQAQEPTHSDASSVSSCSDSSTSLGSSLYHSAARIAARQATDHPWMNQKRSVTLPSKRSYDTHHYYVVQTHSKRSQDLDPRDVADALGAEFVERAGELKDHWLVRFEKPLSASQQLDRREESPVASSSLQKRSDLPEYQDPVLNRWNAIRRSAHQPGFTTQHQLSKRQHSAALSIRDVERQVVRRRHKRNIIYDPAQMPHLYPEIRAPLPGAEASPEPHPFPRPPIMPAAKSAEMIGSFAIKDPIFTDQWHLANDRKMGYDLNLTDVWNQNVLGEGVNVCLIDDGLDMYSPDLKDNFFAAGSYDFNSHVALPEPRETDDQHGTRCAGEIAAVKNDVCGLGVAHKAKVSGVRILSGPISDVDEAASLNYAYQDNHIYSCSWGPPDDGRSMDAPKGLIAKAMLNGIQNGRDGKGSIFVFAGGNGGASDDQCNFDGYTNSIYSMTIAAVDREGQHPYYSEMCSAIIGTSWSSGSGDHIHTTDVAWNGVNRCTNHHGGTSAAAPLAAGVVALGLSVRPDLTWRDVQHIAVRSAVMINPEDPDWQKTQAGRHYNHKYGYGVIDAYQFVEEARRHQLVNPQAWYESPNITLPASETLISDSGTVSSFTITQDMLQVANLKQLEHVTVRVWITHQRRGDVNVELVSPHGTKSALARTRRYDDATTGFPGWSFMSLKHWDESPIGEWKIRVFDNAHPEKVGNFYAWSMTLWGASIDPAKAVPWNFPEDSVEYHETLAAAPETTIIKLPPSYTSSAQLKKPTDHLPSDHGTAPGESHIDFTNNGTSGVGVPVNVNPEADTGYINLKKNSTWVWVAAGLVVIFAASLAAFFVMRRRKGRGSSSGGRGNPSDYEFLATDGEEDDEELAMGDLDGERRGGVRSEKLRKTKELYDAFADDGSDFDDDGEEEGNLLPAPPSKSKSQQRRGLVGRSNNDEPYRDDIIEDDRDGDQRFALHDDQEQDGEDEDQDQDQDEKRHPNPSRQLPQTIVAIDQESTQSSGSGSGSGEGSGSGSGAHTSNDEGSWMQIDPTSTSDR